MPRLSMVTLTELSGLPCPYCGRTLSSDTPSAAAAATVWGWCGVKLVEDGEVAGLLLLAPADEPGQAVVTAVWVRPGRTRAGYGRQLVRTAASGLVAQRAHLMLARGSRHSVTCQAPPREFLRAIGFTRGLEDRLWHLDLDRAVLSERNGVRAMMERLLSSLRPANPPEPAGGAIGRVRGR